MRKRKPGLRSYSPALQRCVCELEVVQLRSPDKEISAERLGHMWLHAEQRESFPFSFLLSFIYLGVKPVRDHTHLQHLPFSFHYFSLRLTCHVWFKVQMAKCGCRVSWRTHLSISKSLLASRWTPWTCLWYVFKSTFILILHSSHPTDSDELLYCIK